MRLTKDRFRPNALFRSDRARPIDRYIDYFGERPASTDLLPESDTSWLAAFLNGTGVLLTPGPGTRFR